MNKIPLTIVHYNDNDPLTTKGGVQTFAKNLGLIFEDVQFMTQNNVDFNYLINNKIPVICDNQFVTDFPKGWPVIGFQHGVQAIKFKISPSKGRRRARRRQKRAAKRPNTLWVACAEWISTTFDQLYKNPADYIIYHPIDILRFDGIFNNSESRLILHDARSKHKGSQLIEEIKASFTDWKFEALNCSPEEVPDRMRQAKAFIHLSRYEGNSIVCNEAMAMNLPCLFTNVGLMRDRDRPTDIHLVETEKVYNQYEYRNREISNFLESLHIKKYNPRQWILNHATPTISQSIWRKVMKQFQQLSGWNLEIE